ncbi:glycosyltransferase family 2 protein [Bradyrhizobium sp. 44]|uniref:glycosyltransferase family 2 protein n=1 Tax=Bradyrhizobium sp. 44 TaxID=2782675 RepID=UPI001FF8201C|nr:glycosyltransferase family 2 protein [Bradyrhizobium sp. 44]MCK1284204.1 glycosyltransferase family 2 protein [Bradyrhizobium sp. 44]
MTSQATPASQGPSVSVIIPAYNAAGCIGRAIASVQAQTEQDFEIIVVNDCSADDTVAVVSSVAAKDSRIRLVSQDKNGGPSRARNRGFAEARGTWLAILDADDAYKRDRLERLTTLAESEALDMIADDITYYDSEADVEFGDQRLSPGFNRIDLAGFLRASMFRPPLHDFSGRDVFQYALLKFVFRRSFVAEYKLAYPETLRDGEDFFFYSECLLAGGRAGLTSEPGYVYTQRMGKVSKRQSALTRTRVDRMQVVTGVDLLLSRHAQRLSSVHRRLLRERRAQAIGLNAHERARDLVRQKQVGIALLELAKTRPAWAFSVHMLLRRRKDWFAKLGGKA